MCRPAATQLSRRRAQALRRPSTMGRAGLEIDLRSRRDSPSSNRPAHVATRGRIYEIEQCSLQCVFCFHAHACALLFVGGSQVGAPAPRGKQLGPATRPTRAYARGAAPHALSAVWRAAPRVRAQLGPNEHHMTAATNVSSLRSATRRTEEHAASHARARSQAPYCAMATMRGKSHHLAIEAETQSGSAHSGHRPTSTHRS